MDAVDRKRFAASATLAHESDVAGEPPRYSGVEFKSLGRQVVAAGSIHPNGNPYFWDALDHADLADAPDAPADLIEAIRRPERTGEAAKSGEYTAEEIARALDCLDVTEFRDHDKWLQLMMAVHHASGGDARSEWIEFSTGDSEYAGDGEVIGRRFDSLHSDKPGGVTYRTLNKILADHGAADAQAAPDASADFEGDGNAKGVLLARHGSATRSIWPRGRGSHPRTLRASWSCLRKESTSSFSSCPTP